MTCLADKGVKKAVAGELGISEGTVKELVGRAKRRIGATTQLAAVIKWDRWERTQ